MDVNSRKQQNLQILEFLCPWQDLCAVTVLRVPREELPKETPSQVTTESVSEDAQFVGQVRKFFTQSGRRSREVRYSCFEVYL